MLFWLLQKEVEQNHLFTLDTNWHTAQQRMWGKANSRKISAQYQGPSQPCVPVWKLPWDLSLRSGLVQLPTSLQQISTLKGLFPPWYLHMNKIAITTVKWVCTVEVQPHNMTYIHVTIQNTKKYEGSPWRLQQQRQTSDFKVQMYTQRISLLFPSRLKVTRYRKITMCMMYTGNGNLLSMEEQPWLKSMIFLLWTQYPVSSCLMSKQSLSLPELSSSPGVPCDKPFLPPWLAGFCITKTPWALLCAWNQAPQYRGILCWKERRLLYRHHLPQVLLSTKLSNSTFSPMWARPSKALSIQASPHTRPMQLSEKSNRYPTKTGVRTVKQISDQHRSQWQKPKLEKQR